MLPRGRTPRGMHVSSVEWPWLARISPGPWMFPASIGRPSKFCCKATLGVGVDWPRNVVLHAKVVRHVVKILATLGWTTSAPAPERFRLAQSDGAEKVVRCQAPKPVVPAALCVSGDFTILGKNRSPPLGHRPLAHLPSGLWRLCGKQSTSKSNFSDAKYTGMKVPVAVTTTHLKTSRAYKTSLCATQTPGRGTL